MASVRKREWTTANGTNTAWVVDYKDQDGKRRSKQFDRKKDADEYRRRAELEVSERRHVHDRDTKTFGDAYHAMYEYEERRGKLAEGTMTNIRRVGRRHVLPDLGCIKLNKLTSERLQEFMIAKHEAGYTTKYLGGMKDIINRTIKYACKRKWCTNPLADQPLEPLENRRRELYKPAVEEVRLLFDAMAHGPEMHEKRASYYSARLMLALAVLGMRRKEIRCQRWENVDFANGTLEIVREATKSDAGCRMVYLPETVRALLYEHWQSQGQPAEGWVLRTRSGSRFSGRKMSGDLWMKIMRRAGLIRPDGRPLFNLHMLRHFFVAYHRDAKIDDRDTMLVVGHASERVMREVYDFPLRKSTASARLVDQMASELALTRFENAKHPPPKLIAPLPAPPLTVPSIRPGRHGKVNVRYANEKRDKVIELHEAGAESYAEIASKTRVSTPTVRLWLNEADADVSRYDRTHSPETWAKVMRLYQEGEPVADICRRYSVGQGQFYHHLKAAGIGLRRPRRSSMQQNCSITG